MEYIDLEGSRKLIERGQGGALTKIQKEILEEADDLVLDSLLFEIPIASIVAILEKHGYKISNTVKALLGLIPSVN